MVNFLFASLLKKEETPRSFAQKLSNSILILSSQNSEPVFSKQHFLEGNPLIFRRSFDSSEAKSRDRKDDKISFASAAFAGSAKEFGNIV